MPPPLLRALSVPTSRRLAGLIDRARGWLGPRPPAEAVEAAVQAEAAPRAGPAAPSHPWPDFTDRLWGPGFTLPGGPAEALRLAALMPLSPETLLLLLEGGPGGMAAAIFEARKTRITAMEADAAIRDQAGHFLRKQGKRLAVAGWDPAAPDFKPRQHNHALVMEVLRRAGDPRRLLTALAGTLKTGGQVVMTDLVRVPATGGDSAEEAADWRRWVRLDRRVAPPPLAGVMAGAFRQAGFHLHVTEQLDSRYAPHAMEAWAAMIRGIEQQPGKLAPLQAALLVVEAERWLLRLRLMALGRLHLRRWHATLVK